MTVLGNVDLNRDGTTDLMLLAPRTGGRINVLYPPASWCPDAALYGTAGAEVIAAAIPCDRRRQ